jgi:hypothetical protein
LAKQDGNFPDIIIGSPDPDHVSTSYAFSKKLANLKASVALHYAHYNFVRIHRTLRMTPAMAAGVTDRQWSAGDLLEAVAEKAEAA